MDQLTLGRVTDPRGGDCWARLLDVLRAAVAAITPKELAFALNVAPSYLLDALRGADRKSVRAEWLPTILIMAPHEHRAAILSELAGPAGYQVERRKSLDPAEELEQLRAIVGRMAPVVLAAADKELGR